MYSYQREHFNRIVEQTSEQAIKAKQEELRAEYEQKGQRESIYPHLAGLLLYYVKEFRQLAIELDAKHEEVQRKEQALRWAAECCLTDKDDDNQEMWERLYSEADVIEQAMKDGMTEEQLRKHLKDGVTDAEIAQGRFLDSDEVCPDCEKYVGRGNKCADCTFEDAA